MLGGGEGWALLLLRLWEDAEGSYERGLPVTLLMALRLIQEGKKILLDVYVTFWIFEMRIKFS